MSRWPLVRRRLHALRRVFRLFTPHLRPHRGRMLAAWLCMLGATAMYLAQPWPIKLIFDYVLLPGGAAGDWLAGRSAAEITTGAALALLVIALLRGLFGYGQTYLTASVGQRVIASVRTRLFRHIQHLSHAFHDERHSGDLLLRLTGDIQLLRDLLVNSLLLLTERGFVMLAVAAVMLWMDWCLALVALAVLPLLTVLSVRASGRIRGVARKQRRRESRTANILSETLSAISVIQAHARESWEAERFARQHKSSLRAGLRATRLEANLNRLVEVVLAAGTAGVLWYGVLRVRAGALTPGDLLVFTAYLTTFYKPVRKLATLASRLAKASVCGERLVAILETAPEIRDAPDATPAPPLRGEIAFRDVHFAYPGGAPVLRGAECRIEAGETVALVGASGVGKSTLAQLLLRFYDPLSGAVCIDGVDIRRYTLASLRAQIAVVLQAPGLFAVSVRDNIAYGRLDASDADIERAARSACAHDFIQALPDGYDTVLAEGGASLSAGQRQRIAIARAIVRDAPIVLLDEPLTGLDPASQAAVEQALTRLVRGRTCLLITHDLAAAARADRVLQLIDGRIEPLALPTAVRSSPPHLQLLTPLTGGTVR